MAASKYRASWKYSGTGLLRSTLMVWAGLKLGTTPSGLSVGACIGADYIHRLEEQAPTTYTG
jgi:hypothetical protein